MMRRNQRLPWQSGVAVAALTVMAAGMADIVLAQPPVSRNFERNAPGHRRDDAGRRRP